MNAIHPAFTLTGTNEQLKTLLASWLIAHWLEWGRDHPQVIELVDATREAVDATGR